MLVLQLVMVVALLGMLVKQFRPPITGWPRERRLAKAVSWLTLAVLTVSAYWETSGFTLGVGIVLFVLSVYLDLRYRR